MPAYPIGPRPGGTASKLNVSATTVIKATPGTLFRVNVVTAGAVGAVYDNNSTSTGNTAANLIAEIPAVVGTYKFVWPAFVGITYVPGAAQVAAFSYS